VQETREKRFSIITFYERRIRRILPALLLVITVCTPFVWIWALPHQLRDFSQSIIATLTFLSNVLFWRETGYFSISAEVKPLLHTWNLAVEEQYYVVLPILAALALRRGLKFTFWPLVARLLDDWSSSDCLLDEPESSW
jgi:peptidoglycan/LPS O-acetylase OafA/YrhL